MSEGVRPGKLLAAAFVVGAFFLAPSSASARAHLDDLWCTSTSACVAVGASDGEEGSSQVHVKRWNGSAWTGEEPEPPEEAVTSELSGVACVSASDCATVGRLIEGSAPVAVAMRWDGTDWEREDLSAPEGARATELADVACSSGSACIAVGSYNDAEDVKKSLAMRWDGSTWSLLSVPVPSGAGLSELEAVSCTASNDCVAVGSFVNSSEVTKTLAVVWNGTSWSTVSTPEPSGAELNQLYDVSCRPSDACTAVGTYFDSTGEQKTLALRRNTSKEWSIQSTPNKSGALSRSLTAISCPSTTSCVATGVVEQGKREIPIALGWNGSTWSEQAIDTEALGAVAVHPESVFCTSSSSCDAVGSVSYGRSSARRNLAFHFNGSVWLLSEAGGYEREWQRFDVTRSTSGMNGLSCPEAQRCVAVGTLIGDTEGHRSHVATLEDEAWARGTVPVPEGAVASDLIGVSCTTFSWCRAVGRYVDEEDVIHLLVMSWNGSAWSIQSAPSPEGALASDLVAVDCVSTSACTAVGSYVDEENTQRPLGLTYNGSTWSLVSVDSPAGAGASWLSAVSCASGTSCVAAGGRADPFGHEESFAVGRSGASWSTQEVPEVDDNMPNELLGISCASTSSCLAVGFYQELDEERRALAFSWDGSDWEEVDAPAVDGGRNEGLNAVSCAAADDCVTVGGRAPDSTQPPLLARWDGDSWAAEPPVDFPSGASAVSLAAVSCATGADCAAAGSASFGGFAVKALALVAKEGNWTVPYSSDRGGGLRGISCPDGNSCLAVGDSIDPGGAPATAWSLGEDGWKAGEASAAAGAYLSDASCLEETDCVGVGRQSSWPFKPLAARWDGEDWSSDSIPAPSGRSASLESVSCPVSGWCAAAGFSWPSEGLGAGAALIETWNGSSWQIASAPAPEAAVSAFLHDVACTSSSACTAVGSYTNSAGTSHGLIERWNGSSWSHATISPPAGASYRLLGVDCSSSSACTAVGSVQEEADGSVSALAVRWNGTSWSAETVVGPEGSSASVLRDVDCYSSLHCVAVGRHGDSSTSQPLIAARHDGTWSIEPAPIVEGATTSTLEAVSCPSAGDCVAVGGTQSEDSPQEILAIQPQGEDPEFDPPTVATGEEGPLTLSNEQLEAAMDLLEEDTSFQAAVGTAEYDYEVGPWTELDESGAETLVGTFVEVTLDEEESWTERSWPAAAYELGANGYEAGSHLESGTEAAASDITVLHVGMELELDSNGYPIAGETVEILPIAAAGGTVTLDPEEIGEYNELVAGY